jgi:hypothetical protein
MKSELARFIKRGLRQGSWPLLQRYAVLPKILDLPAIEFPHASDFCVHIRVCERDALMLHWAIRSFARHTPMPCTLVIHDDGTCSRKTLASFANKFHGAEIISRKDASKRISKKLQLIPDLWLWWQNSFEAIKWFDFYLLGKSKYIIFLDSDVLFFASPSALFENLDRAMWMRDCFDSLYIDRHQSHALFGKTELPQLNSGLGRVPREWFDLNVAQEVFRFMLNDDIRSRAIHLGLPQHDDQTFNAILTAVKGGYDYLPTSYQVATEPGLKDAVAKHYTTPSRFWFYEEGIPRTAAQLKFKLSRWLRERM